MPIPSEKAWKAPAPAGEWPDGSRRGAGAAIRCAQLPTDNESTTALGFGDVDNDGDLDLVVGNGPWGTPQQDRLYLNNGSGTFTVATTMPFSGDSTSSVVLGDVDGDGDLDIVRGRVLGQNSLYLTNGAGSFTDVTATHMPPDLDYTNAVVFGDVDGDGDLDIVCGNGCWQPPSTPPCPGIQNRLYLNNGWGHFIDVTALQMPPDGDFTQGVACGDVDGDGDLDLVCSPRLYLNNGAGTFASATASSWPSFLGASAVLLADLDDDGDLDAVIGCAGGGVFLAPQDNLYLNDGAGAFTDVTAMRMPATGPWLNTTALACGDIDGDGDVDLAFGDDGLGGQQSRLYCNLQRQLHAPTAPQIGQPYGLDAYLRYGPSSTIDLAAVYLSTASASIPLGLFGTLGIDPTQAAPFPTLILPQPAGFGSVAFTVPNVPSLVGQELYSQALLIAYPGDLRLSNVVRDVIQ